MAVESPNGDELRTALVVLADRPTKPGGYTLADGRPGLPQGAETVRKWFLSKGFDVDPVVGIAFSISGPSPLFNRTFGNTDDGAGLELDQAALAGRIAADVLPYVAAVVVGPPPAFGPSNP